MRSVKYGFSLLEVVVSLALLGTLIAAALVSHGRAARQISLANSKLNAVEAADKLLETWILQENTNVPINQIGVCGNDNEFGWKTGQLVQIQNQIGKIRLEVFDPTLEQKTPIVSTWLITDYVPQN